MRDSESGPIGKKFAVSVVPVANMCITYIFGGPVKVGAVASN